MTVSIQDLQATIEAIITDAQADIAVANSTKELNDVRWGLC